MFTFMKRLVAYLFAIGIVIIVILLFIDRMITPIFILHPGGPGFIPVPGFDDGVLFWKNQSGNIPNSTLPIQHQSFGYSFILDVFIQNPMQFSSRPRILWSRGADANQAGGQSNGNTILSVVTNYNLVIALLPDTTDLIVSVLNKDNNMENVIIPNIPVQEPFRLGVIVLEQALEVYMNGHLMKTRTFDAPPKDVRGDINPAAGIEANLVKLRTLKLWSRIITTSEMRYAKPALTSAAQFGAGPIPGSTSCGTSSSSSNTWSLSDLTSQVKSLSGITNTISSEVSGIASGVSSNVSGIANTISSNL
jgi:hypothetical protein